jgi:hypothetical protein
MDTNLENEILYTRHDCNKKRNTSNCTSGVSRYWVKQMYTAALRLGKLLDEHKKTIDYVFSGELRKKSAEGHSKNNSLYIGDLTIEGEIFNNIMVVINKHHGVITFWPETQHADARKSVTDPLVNLYLDDIENLKVPDSEYTFERVATHYHKIFKKNPGINPQRIMNNLYKDSSKFPQEEINTILNDLDTFKQKNEFLQQENEDLTDNLLLAALETDEQSDRADAAELKAKDETDKRIAVEKNFENFKAEYKENQVAAHISNDEQPESMPATDNWNPGVFTLIKARPGVDYPDKDYKKLVVRLELKNKDGELFTVKNNWGRGLTERLQLAKQLEGQKIVYSTWNSHKYSSKIWFKNIALANDQVVIDGESFFIEETYLDLAKELVENQTHEDHSSTDGVHYGDDLLGRANTAYEERDYDKAIKLYLEINSPEATHAAASVLFYQKKYNESFKYMQKAADDGSTDAFGGLAKCYREGWGVEIDYKKSEYWTLKGANSKDTICMTLAGSGYIYGTFGFKKDPQLGLQWLGTAVMFKDATAEKILKDLGMYVEFLDDGQMKFNKIQ